MIRGLLRETRELTGPPALFPDGDSRGRARRSQLRDPSGPRMGTDRAFSGVMSNWKTGLTTGLLGLMLAAGAAPAAQAAVVVIHGPREAPPPIVEEHPAPRRGYVWVGGHHG